MMLRIFIALLTAVLPLSAAQQGMQNNLVKSESRDPFTSHEACATCNRCETSPSAASLLQALQLLLSDELLLLPPISAPLAAQLQTILVTNGVVPARSFGDFFALMPGDNAATVGAGTPVSFPQNGPSSGGVVRTNATTFLLPNIGTYQIFFQVSVTEAGQLVLALNSGSGFIELPATVVGRATGTSQIVGMSYVTTTAPNSLIQVWNPTGNSPALTITPVAGGTHAVSAHLVILQL